MEERKRVSLMLGVEDNLKLDILAAKLDRSKMSLEREAIKEYLAKHAGLYERDLQSKRYLESLQTLFGDDFGTFGRGSRDADHTE